MTGPGKRTFDTHDFLSMTLSTILSSYEGLHQVPLPEDLLKHHLKTSNLAIIVVF